MIDDVSPIEAAKEMTEIEPEQKMQSQIEIKVAVAGEIPTRKKVGQLRIPLKMNPPQTKMNSEINPLRVEKMVPAGNKIKIKSVQVTGINVLPVTVPSKARPMINGIKVNAREVKGNDVVESQQMRLQPRILRMKMR